MLKKNGAKLDFQPCLPSAIVYAVLTHMSEPDKTQPQTIVVLGTPISIVDMSGTLARIEAMVQSGGPHYIVTPNVDFVVQAREDQELHRILCDADLVICDGMPLVWASKWFGNPIPERVAGSDLATPLLELAHRKQMKLFLLGAAEAINEKAAAMIRLNYPGVQLVGNYSPAYAALVEMDHADINRRIKEAAPDILLVGFGCPKQEKWISMNYRQIGVPVSIGVGATVDFIAGKVSRAPKWMRQSGLEWLYRLCREPGRMWKRYGKDILVFMSAMIRYRRYIQWGTKRPHLPEGPTSRDQDSSGPVGVLEIPERFDAACAAVWGPIIADYMQQSEFPRFDLAGVQFIDSTGLGELIRIRKSMKDAGKEYCFHQCSEVVMKLFKLTKLTDQFKTSPDPAPLVCSGSTQDASWGASYRYVANEQCKCIKWMGALDAENAPLLQNATNQFISTSPRTFKQLEIDLSQVTDITSATVVVMKQLNDQAEQAPWDLQIVGANEKVKNVLSHAKALHLIQGDRVV